MSARKTAPSRDGAVYLPNANPNLRVIYVRIDAKGRTVETDRPIVGWYLDALTPPRPITPGGVPEQTELVVIRDNETKTWFNPVTGDTSREWKDVLRPLFETWDRKQPQKLEPPSSPPSEPVRVSIDPGTPVIGAAPRAWKPSR